MKKRLVILFLFAFIIINLVAAIHAYRFTHTINSAKKTLPPEKLSFIAKIKIIAFGIDLPKIKNSKDASSISKQFKSIILTDKFETPIWFARHNKAKGLIIIFHGYSGNRETVLHEGRAFYEMGYSVALVDFPGHGDSLLNVTTLGYREAEVVQSVFQYFQKTSRQKIFVYGVSMGATAIMRAVAELELKPAGAILDYPYYSLVATARKRFEVMGLKFNFPLPELLTFWGGMLNGFNAFSLNSFKYAKLFKSPALLFGGAQDVRVPPEHLRAMQEQMSNCKLVIIPRAKHESLLKANATLYLSKVQEFLNAQR